MLYLLANFSKWRVIYESNESSVAETQIVGINTQARIKPAGYQAKPGGSLKIQNIWAGSVKIWVKDLGRSRRAAR